MRRLFVTGLVLALLAGAGPVAAQGHRGAPPGQLKKPAPEGTQVSVPDGPSGEIGLVPGTVAPRSFGTWLDDATLAAPGAVWVNVSVLRWSAPAGYGLDAPAIGVAAGLGTRAQLSFNVPFSRSAGTGEPLSGGLGDVYAGLKLQLVAPSSRRPAIAIGPTLEVLNSTGTREAHLVLPVSIEAGSGRTRFYASTGLFTRGAAFAAGALERHLSDRLAVTGALLQSWTTADALATEGMGLGRSRTDVSGSIVTFIGSSVAVFGGISRTLSRMEFDSSRYAVSGGVAFELTSPAAVPVRLPR